MTQQVGNEPTPLTDVGNGERFAKQHGGQVKYIHTWKKWLVWNGRYWEFDVSGEVERLAKQTVRSVYMEASQFSDSSEAKEVAKWAHHSQSKFRIAAMLDMAKSEQPIPLDYRTLDCYGWQLNCENGVIDLTTGDLCKHRPEDFITMSTGIEYPVGPIESPLWARFLNDAFEGNEELIGYVQRLCGVALVGKVIEHILPMAIGVGCNGKSVFCETIRSLLGDYAMAAPQGLLMVKRNQAHSTEVADLSRKRLVTLSETNDGSRLDEGLVKSLTGGDAIRARRMREDNWEFVPTHTLILSTNHRPVVKGQDVGIWRRIRLIPFNAQIAAERQDPHLTEKLRAEWPAILLWMVAGCLDWQQNGLCEPDEVKLATNEYKAEQDILGSFITDCCLIGPSYRVKCSTLYEVYRKWCLDSGETIQSNRKFKAGMVEREFECKKSGTNWFLGITVSET